MSSDIAGYVTLTLRFQTEGDIWVGECLELSTSTDADTLEECQIALDELVETHMDVLDEVGERDRFFDEWGVVVHPDGHALSEVSANGYGDRRGKSVEDSHLGPIYKSRVYPIPVAQRDGLLRLIERRGI